MPPPLRFFIFFQQAVPANYGMDPASKTLESSNGAGCSRNLAQKF
jgi:hypothetical protein